jgi:VWFA-related protein
MKRRDFLCVVSAAGAWAQERDPKFTSSVRVVNVLATVRNKKGEIVTRLGKEDFRIEEEGRPQEIRYFSAQSDLPLTLGLLADTSGSMSRVLEAERKASYRFLEQVLREDRDKAFVIHFDREVELLQDLTSSRKELEAAIRKLEASEPAPGGRAGGGGYPGGGSGPRIGFPVPGRYPGGGGPPRPPTGRGGGGSRRMGGTTLYDAVLLASEEMMRKQTGRKAIILLSDGQDTGSKVSLPRAIEAAQRADTLVYAIHIADSRRGGRGPGGDPADGRKVLERIAKETGGGCFKGSGNEKELAKTYRQIEEELRNQYNLGYTPGKAGAGEFRRIQVTTRDQTLIVRSREGYYAES